MIFGSGYIKDKFVLESKGRDSGLFIYAFHEKMNSYTETIYDELCQHLKEFSTNRKLIFFSTLSLYDVMLNNDEYVVFNKRMEDWIRHNVKSYIIFRLPIIVGNTSDNTLINHIYNCISNSITINVFQNATRYVMDIDDVIEYVFKYSHQENKCIDLVITDPIRVVDIIDCLSNVINRKSKVNFSNEGYRYQLPYIDYVDHNIYLTKIFSKYYKYLLKD